jgi:hypothetical protein
MAAPEFPPAGTSSSRAGSANDGAQSSPHPFEQARPCAPGQHDERIGVISAEKENVVAGEPRLQRDEAGAGFAGLHLGDERRFLATKRIDVDIMTAAAEARGSGQGIALTVNAEGAMSINELALDASALLPMASTTHVGTPSGTGFACGKR